jgi:putative ABC transport system permease protein
MRPHTLLYFYGRRLRTHPIQELLAGLGIAIGVALAFAVLVANSSITASAREISRGLAGEASVQLVARDMHGFDERLLNRVHELPGVARASGLLEQRAILVGPNGRPVPTYVAGADPSLAALGGVVTRSLSANGLELKRGILLPSALAEALGLPATYREAKTGPGSLPRVSFHIRGRVFRVKVGAVLGHEAIGPTADAMAALAPRTDLQRVAGLPGRITRILVRVEPGRENDVREELTAIAAGRITVSSPEDDPRLVEQATVPNDRATAFFAMISALVGLLLAFNAMLLTAPERRRVIADLRIQGYKPHQLFQLVLFQVAVLGISASVVGLFVGDLLARTLLEETPEYLAAAFAIGTQTEVGVESVALAFLGGVAAACLAAAPPLLDLRRSRPVDAVYREAGEPGQALGAGASRNLLVAAVVVLVVTGSLLLVADSAAIIAVIGLAIGTLLATPAVFIAVLRVTDLGARRARRLNMLTVALFALRATTLRSLALCATGAIAVFGSVAIAGARQDLLQGLYRGYWGYVDTADLWVVNGADDLATKDFPRRDLPERVAAVPGVSAVRAYHGGFLDFGGRRTWLIARSSANRSMVPATEVVKGELSAAQKRLRTGSWITVSDQIATDFGVEPGETLTLPTPTGDARYRIAATTTNLGWPPGAIIMEGAEYRRAWATSDRTALEVDLHRGADLEAAKRAVESALGAGVALQVQTARERADQANALARQAVERLSQISTLLLIAAALAMAAAIGAAIWQRRAALAAMRLQSFRPSQLRRVLLLESAVVLAAGCLAGAIAGVYGQFLIDRYLVLTTGFSASFTPAVGQTARTFLLVVVIALAALAIPGSFAARSHPRLGFQE